MLNRITTTPKVTHV